MRFRSVPVPTVSKAEQELLDKLEGLSQQVATLNGQLRGRKTVLDLTEETNKLKTEIADLQIQKSKLTEEHEREKREVQHYVGLEKKRQTVEIEQARREATLAVREENLESDKKRFEAHIEFVEKQTAQHLGDIKDLLGQVMGHIPNVNVDIVREAK